MSNTTENADLITLTVEITAVTWAKPDGSWSIVRTTLDSQQDAEGTIPSWLKKQGKVSVVGNLGPVQAGDMFDVTGTIENSKYGRQVKAQLAERCVRSTDRAIQAFLRSFPQIGKVRAKEITEHFGGFEGVIDVLDNDPDRLTEIKGIDTDRAQAISVAYSRAVGRRDALLFTAEIGASQRLSAKIINHFGGKAREALTADPYAVMDIRGVSFEQADQLARGPFFKVAKDDPRRTAAAADHVLAAATNDGHVYSTLDHLVGSAASKGVERALKETGLNPDLLKQGLHVLSEERQVGPYTRKPSVIIVEDRYYPAHLYGAEQRVASNMARLLKGSAAGAAATAAA